jgi:hypothetical protein
VNGAPRQSWMQPSAIIGVLGMAGMILTAVNGFQTGTNQKIAELNKTIAVLEWRVAQLERGR